MLLNTFFAASAVVKDPKRNDIVRKQCTPRIFQFQYGYVRCSKGYSMQPFRVMASSQSIFELTM